jgi:hypothetical protein
VDAGTIVAMDMPAKLLARHLVGETVTITVTNELSTPRAAVPRTVSRGAALMTLARPGFALSAQTPREIIVPLLTAIPCAPSTTRES